MGVVVELAMFDPFGEDAPPIGKDSWTEQDAKLLSHAFEVPPEESTIR